MTPEEITTRVARDASLSFTAVGVWQVLVAVGATVSDPLVDVALADAGPDDTREQVVAALAELLDHGYLALLDQAVAQRAAAIRAEG